MVPRMMPVPVKGMFCVCAVVAAANAPVVVAEVTVVARSMASAA